MPSPTPDRFMRITEVIDTVGLSRSEIYRLIKKDLFPPPIKLVAVRNAPALWVAAEIQSWMHARVNDWRGPSASKAIAAE